MSDSLTSIVILSERSLPAVAQMGPPKSTASRARGISGSTPWWPSAMGDNFVSIVILSERSLPAVAGEPKDLYLSRHAHTRNERDPLEGGVSDGSAETRATERGGMK